MTKLKEKYNLHKMIMKSKITDKHIIKMFYSLADHISELTFEQSPDYDFIKE
jgi:uncharacterized protein YktA (UPF0223 family)